MIQENPGLSHWERQRRLGEQWRALPESEQKPYMDKVQMCTTPKKNEKIVGRSAMQSPPMMSPRVCLERLPLAQSTPGPVPKKCLEKLPLAQSTPGPVPKKKFLLGSARSRRQTAGAKRSF